MDCNAVEQDHDFMTLFWRQAQLQPVAFWARYFIHPNPMTHYRRWTNRRGLDAIIGKVVDERYASQGRANEGKTANRQRAAIDYALDMCRADLEMSHGTAATAKLDPETRDNIITQ